MRGLLELKLHWQILIALGLAVMAGSLTEVSSGLFGVRFYEVYDFLGTLFLNALKMLIVPLITASIITGVGGIGKSGALGRLGGKTLLYYFSTSLIAILVGLFLVNLFAPGIVDGQPAKEILGLKADTGVIAERAESRGAADVLQLFLQMVPPNIVAAAANGQMLGLIFFSLLFGFFMARVKKPYGQVVANFWQGVFQVMMHITDWVMKFAPIGVFALVAKIVADTGLDVFRPLAVFMVTVLAALAVHMFLAHARRTYHQNIFRCDLVTQRLVRNLGTSPSVTQRYRHGTLGVVLADNVLIQFLDDFAWRHF